MNLFEKQCWARGRVDDWWKKACDAFGYTEDDRARQLIPSLEFSNRMTRTAGYAYSSRRHIKLSNHFLMNEEEDFDKTIGHEVAHVFADRHFGTRCGHGPFWRKVMIAIGLPPNRCHAYESVVIKRQDRLNYTCTGCGQNITLSKNRIGRIRSGSRSYHCTRCRTSLDRTSVLRQAYVLEK